MIGVAVLGPHTFDWRYVTTWYQLLTLVVVFTMKRIINSVLPGEAPVILEWKTTQGRNVLESSDNVLYTAGTELGV